MVGASPQASQSGTSKPFAWKKPGEPPSRSLRNRVPQANAPAKLGIMNGKVESVATRPRPGRSVSVTSQARKPPTSRQPAATPRPSSIVVSSGRHQRLAESGLASTVSQAWRPSGVSVASRILTSGAATRSAITTERTSGRTRLARSSGARPDTSASEVMAAFPGARPASPMRVPARGVGVTGAR